MMKRIVFMAALAIAIMGSAIVVNAQSSDRIQPIPAASTYQPTSEELVLNAVYEEAVQSVVNLSVITRAGGGSGSGFVIDTDGHIVTNNHVVENAEFVQVTFWDGRTTEADLIGTDPDSDLAVIRVDPTGLNLYPIELADSDTVFVGQNVLALGNPFGQNSTLTTGIVSALDRSLSAEGNFSIPEVIQTDAAINPGNSGGPLLDLSGRVIGVNTAILSESRSGSGVGFAVPSNQVRRVAPYLIAQGEYNHSWLGISGTTLQPAQIEQLSLASDSRGVVVASITPNGPAARAGLIGSEEGINTDFGVLPIGGDIIVAIDGNPVGSMAELIEYLNANTLPGDAVSVDIIRDGQNSTLTVTLGQRPS